MFSKNSSLIFRCLRLNSAGRHCKFSTSKPEVADEPDPAPLFFNDDVQKLLKTLTRPDPKRVYRVRKFGKPIADPKYRFMTDAELNEALKQAHDKIDELLQMPPVVSKRKPIHGILSKDPALQGHDTCKYVFTDITYGVSHVDRLIVVRDPNGILRYADWDERTRMNQIYDPIEGREMNAPKMFRNEYLQDLLKREEYEFVLDRACLQYDPDDPEYHRVTQAVYEAINSASHFDKLRSTRHYGPLTFHLAWTKNINNLLLENITTRRIEDAALLIQLYNKIHPSSKSAEFSYDGDDVKYIQNYIETESPIRGKLTSALQAYKEIEATRKKIEEGVKKAHGFEE